MHNLVYLIGRLVKDPEVRELEDGKKVSNVTLAVQRAYKNEEGVYETDFIDCALWNGVANNTTEYCKKGDLVGIKGRLQTNTFEKDGEMKSMMNVMVDKVSFLATKKDPECAR